MCWRWIGTSTFKDLPVFPIPLLLAFHRRLIKRLPLRHHIGNLDNFDSLDNLSRYFTFAFHGQIARYCGHYDNDIDVHFDDSNDTLIISADKNIEEIDLLMVTYGHLVTSAPGL